MYYSLYPIDIKCNLAIPRGDNRIEQSRLICFLYRQRILTLEQDGVKEKGCFVINFSYFCIMGKTIL